MFKNLIINAAMLVAFISLCYQIFGYIGFNKSLRLKLKFLAGFLFGMLGIILLEFSIKLSNDTVMDFRELPIIIASIYGGSVAGMTSCIIVATVRLFRFGISSTSVFAASMELMVGFVACYFSTRKITIFKKWVWITGITQLLISLIYFILIDNLRDSLLFISTSVAANIMVSIPLYYYVNYLEQYTDLFRRYRSESNIDFLTGLNNVRQFDKVFNEIISEVKYSDGKLSLLFIDIDFFKKVNDTYGHKEGDIVLKKLGQILKSKSRTIDIVSRNGGEEFSVILFNCEPEVAYEISENIRLAVERDYFELSNGTKIKITVSIGIASYPDEVVDVNMLCERADEALYMAKRTGRNKVVSYTNLLIKSQ